MFKIQQIKYLALAGVLSALSTLQGQDYNDCCTQNLCGSGSFTIGGDWLHWTVEDTQGFFANDVTVEAESEGSVAISSKALKSKTKYSDGFRIFGDYTTADKLWKFSADGVHISSKGKHAFESLEGNNFALLIDNNFPLLTIPFTFNLLAAKRDFSITYADIDISRAFSVCECLEVVPHIGFRGYWRDQTFKIAGTSSVDEFSFAAKHTGKISGGGLEGGVKASWKIWDNLFLRGDIGGSVLYISNRNKTEFVATDIDGDVAIRTKFSDCRGIPSFDAFIGLEYSSTLCNFGYSIHVGWEEHIFFDEDTFSLVGNGNTTLQGLTLGASVSF